MRESPFLRYLLPPRQGNEARMQKGRILHVALLITGVGVIPIGILNYQDGAFGFANLLFAISLLSFANLIVHHRGYYQLAASYLSIVIFVAIAYTIIDGAVLSDPGVAALPIFIILTSLFFEKKAVIASTLISVGFLAFLYYLDVSDVLALAYPVSSSRVIILSVIMIAIGIVAWAIVDLRDKNINDLLSREAFSQSIVDSQTEFIVRWLPDGTRVFVNGAYCHHYALSMEEAIGTNFMDLIVEEDRSFIRDKIARITPDNPVEIAEHRVINPDGSIGWQEWVDQGIFNEEGKVIEYQSLGRDITKRKQAEQALRESEGKFRSYTENTPNIVFTIDRDAEILYMNHAPEGVELDQIIGTEMYRYMDPEFHEIAEENVRKVFEDGEHCQYETRGIGPHGKQSNYLSNIGPIFGDQGKVISAIISTQVITERKEMEQALIESEEFLRQIQKVAGIGTYNLDIPTEYWESSLILDDIFGIDENYRKDVQGWLQIVHPKDRAMMQDYFSANVLTDHEPFDKEYRIQRIRDKKDAWVHGRGELEFDNNGQAIRMIGTIQDITDRKQVVQSIKTSEKSLQKVQEVARVGFLDWQFETNEIFLSDRVVELFKLEPGMNWTTPEFVAQVVHPDDLERVQKNLARLEEGKTPQDINHRIVRSDGETIWVHARHEIIFDEYGEPESLLGTIIDITEQVLNQELLRESEEKFRNYVETSQDLIWECDAEGKFTYLNPAWEQVTGYQLSEMLGEPFTNFTLPEEVETNTAEFTKHLEGGSVRGFPSTYISKDGPEISLIFNAIPLLDSNNNIIGTQGSAYDVTERVQMERDKDLLLEQVQVANERLRFLSHELINSQEEERRRIAQELHDELGGELTTLSLDLERIQDSLPAEALQAVQELLSEAMSSVKNLDDMISDLALDLRPSLLDDLGLLPTLRWHIDRYSQRVDVDIEMNLTGLGERLSPSLETAIYRIIQEALTNVARHARASNIVLNLERTASFLMLSVEDDGEGFDTSELDTPSDLHQGLGLNGIQDRVSFLKGSMEIHSEPGEGTRIDIEIPL